MNKPDPGNSGPDEWTADDDDFFDADLRKPGAPDVGGIEVNRDPIDMSDDEAILAALQEGQRDRLNPEELSLEDRMRFGLLTKDDDIARVEGRLGEHVSTGQHDVVGGVGRTNIFNDKDG